MFNRFKKKSPTTPKVDIHSHLIPAIDDGVRSVEQSVEIIRKLEELGYQKAITTPHIHPNYSNAPDKIQRGLESVQNKLKAEGISFELEAAAEYFVDDSFIKLIKSNSEILSFGDRYVLVESSFINKSLYFETYLFELKSKGYRPVLAHPERYTFLEGEVDWLLQLKEMGVLLQVTISSFVGYYGAIPKKIAKVLYEKEMIDFLGSDLHKIRQIDYLNEGLKLKEVEKLCTSSSLLNKELL